MMREENPEIRDFNGISQQLDFDTSVKGYVNTTIEKTQEKKKPEQLYAEDMAKGDHRQTNNSNQQRSSQPPTVNRDVLISQHFPQQEQDKNTHQRYFSGDSEISPEFAFGDHLNQQIHGHGRNSG